MTGPLTQSGRYAVADIWRAGVHIGIVTSVLGGLVAGLAAALAIEVLDRRVRRPEDLLVTAGVPVIGVLRPAGSSRPVFRKMLMVNNGSPHRPALVARRRRLRRR